MIIKLPHTKRTGARVRMEKHPDRLGKLVLIRVQIHLTLSDCQVWSQKGTVGKIPGSNVEEPGYFVQGGQDEGVTVLRSQSSTYPLEFGLIGFTWEKDQHLVSIKNYRNLDNRRPSRVRLMEAKWNTRSLAADSFKINEVVGFRLNNLQYLHYSEIPY